jgi:hypothetical protein
MALIRDVLDTFEKTGDLTVVVSRVHAEDLGDKYIEVREQVKSTGTWGRGVLLPLDIAGQVAATIIDGLAT